MSLIGLIILLIIAAIAGSLGQALAGYSVGGCLISIVVGFIGAFLGLLKDRAFKPQIDHLIDKYSEGCRRVLCDIKLKSLPLTVDEDKVKDVLDHVDRYLKDADYYKVDRKPTALTSVAYAEGILDALKLMGIVEFEW